MRAATAAAGAEGAAQTTVADGFWFIDRKTGMKGWMTGDAMLNYVRTVVRCEAQRLADATAKLIADERARHRAEMQELRRELDGVRGVRIVAGKDAA